jgi:hypothetical protein
LLTESNVCAGIGGGDHKSLDSNNAMQEMALQVLHFRQADPDAA